jgi:hypothetical protein
VRFCADNRSPEEAEALKQQQLKEQKDGKGKWHEGLASDSESAVSLPGVSVGSGVVVQDPAVIQRERESLLMLFL